MDRIKGLLREPALLIDAGETLVIFLVAFGVGINGDQQSYLVAAIIALVGLAKAFTTTPFAVTALTDAVRAVLVVAASFGVGLSADQIAIAATAVGTLVTLVARGQITPRRDPVVVAGGAGAGPVTGEAGVGSLALVGLVLIVLGLVLLLFTALGAFPIDMIWCIVLVVIGVVLYVWGGRANTRF